MEGVHSFNAITAIVRLHASLLSICFRARFCEEAFSMFFPPLGFPLDMLRCESLLGLDQATCSRVLNKNYKLLVSMAPLSNEIRPISSCTPQV